MTSKCKALVVGAGLAGSEAAWQLAQRGVPVDLVEMRPATMTKAHKTGLFAELVCSNSLRGAALTNAVGLLKEELRIFGSLIMEAADASRVPAGGALAVDRERFSHHITQALTNHPLITIRNDAVQEIPNSSVTSPVIIATGPLTTSVLASRIEKLVGEGSLAFFDAISPIVTLDSLDQGKLFRQSRYDKGGGADYFNSPLSKDEYLNFIDLVSKAEKYGGNAEVEGDSLDRLRPFEGCMPIEEMIARGEDTLRFGPLKPTGLRDPRTGKRPYAVMQLRQDDHAGKLWSMVGLQTRMKRHEQERILRLLPGLEQAEFVRYGSVHRNTFINSPRVLNATLQFRGREGLFFAGQITGVEGYVESTSGGLVAGVNAARLFREEAAIDFPKETAIGSLMNYISDPSRSDFQPMNISYGLMPHYIEVGRSPKRSKNERRHMIAEQALSTARVFAQKTSPICEKISALI